MKLGPSSRRNARCSPLCTRRQRGASERLPGGFGTHGKGGNGPSETNEYRGEALRSPEQEYPSSTTLKREPVISLLFELIPMHNLPLTAVRPQGCSERLEGRGQVLRQSHSPPYPMTDIGTSCPAMEGKISPNVAPAQESQAGGVSNPAHVGSPRRTVRDAPRGWITAA